MSGSTVTVVIPTRDRPQLVARAVRSVMAQGEGLGEVVVVDDGSSAPLDPGPLAALGPAPLRVLRNERSVGVAEARNQGARAARSAWVAFLDDDDAWAPGKLAQQLPRAGAGIAFLYSDCLLVTPGFAVLSRAVAPGAEELPRTILEYCAVHISTLVVRTDVFTALGGFDVGFDHLDDWDLLVRVVHGYAGAGVPEPLTAYVQHVGGKVITDRGLSVLRDVERFRRKHGELARAHGVDPRPRGIARWAALRQAAAGRRLRGARTALVAALAWRDPRLALWALTVPLRGAPRPAPEIPRPRWLDELAAAAA